jgi:hypothetical protein
MNTCYSVTTVSETETVNGKKTVMYGKRRIVVSRDNRVSIQGSRSGKGGSYHPIGKLELCCGKWNSILVGRVWVGEYITKTEAKKQLLWAYKTSDHCLFPEEI